MNREIHAAAIKMFGKEHRDSCAITINLGIALIDMGRPEEAKPLLRDQIPFSVRCLGPEHEVTLTLRWKYACAIGECSLCDPNALREAISMLEAVLKISRRVLGAKYPTTKWIQDSLTYFGQFERAQDFFFK